MQWSIWLSSSTMPAMALSRRRRAGCSGAKLSSCARMSGDALHSTHSTPSSLRAIDDCVRRCARRLPLRTPAHWRQLQFHCGKPPPAAEPRTRMCMADAPEGRPGQRIGWPGDQSTVGEIHRHFEANAQIGKRGFSPHGSFLFLCPGDSGRAINARGAECPNATFEGVCGVIW
ncbi:hypothetical protein D3C81_1566210 [compost metagenome]